MKETKNGFERLLLFEPAFDKRNSDPKKNYGIHGVDMLFLLKKENRAVQFVVSTNWQLPHLRKEWNEEVKALFLQPMPSDLGYHSPTPTYEGQEPLRDDEPCPFIGCVCYYDGSTLNAEEPFNILVSEGEEALWTFLESYFADIFTTTK